MTTTIDTDLYGAVEDAAAYLYVWALKDIPQDLRDALADAAAKETVALVDSMGNAAPKVLDASTAHRVAPGWTYGFPELEAGQADKIRQARKVSNPGCYPTGSVALIRPLIDAVWALDKSGDVSSLLAMTVPR